MEKKLVDLTNLTNSNSTDIREKFQENLSKASSKLGTRFEKAVSMLNSTDLEKNLSEMITTRISDLENKLKEEIFGEVTSKINEKLDTAITQSGLTDMEQRLLDSITAETVDMQKKVHYCSLFIRRNFHMFPSKLRKKLDSQWSRLDKMEENLRKMLETFISDLKDKDSFEGVMIDGHDVPEMPYVSP
ncbi:hypothetical protein Avbf_01677 [Armadillidium vulgare]|nr:hypothetical protein Avbf_01677 [Armadillidium vulgare]